MAFVLYHSQLVVASLYAPDGNTEMLSVSTASTSWPDIELLTFA